MRILLIIIFSNVLSGCTVMGIFLDETARSKLNINSTNSFVKDKDSFSFSKLGYETDNAIIEFIKEDNGVIKKCRQVTKVLKECVEVDKSTLHSNEPKPIKTDDEIISVGL
ncbi:hypothetical protein PI2015_1377 [Pseudoalteromonas issachenkonii]|uniref:Lipoprotein n=1 Tax=Pseudoalteromonas issachenkonii TaxID=152297 RepID=A0ABM6N2S9_9GAMM|nr:hypothetical protein [Pseudoalteromonas issachenkonii]ALQ54681.1 hypothetical protein PI2015_1377 [Pseudoalteromonas issachenkonii]ATC90490.1 hypothetical protein PISS_a1578 [Pseudoalteromonas issachenkonii]